MADDHMGTVEDSWLTSDRSRVPKYGSDLVGAGQLSLTKYGAPIVALGGVVVSGLAPVFGLGHFPTFASLNGEMPKVILALGFMAVVATAVLGVTILYAADIRARALATAASLSLRKLPDIHVAPPGAAGSSLGLWVRRQDAGSEPFMVIAADHHANENPPTTHFLLARQDITPVWVKEQELHGWEVRSGNPARS